MDHETGWVHRVIRRADDVAIHVNFHQVRGLDLAVHQAKGVDQELVVRAGDAHGDVVVDQFVPAEMIEQAVGTGQLLAHPCFGRRGRHVGQGKAHRVAP